jgi:tRNA dimethylallyltransferase
VEHRAILIAGPTASGKSALALRLAQQHRGRIINADSMQVYRELAILTARPGPSELAIAPHALYGHVAGNEAYSVGKWLGDVELEIRESRRQGLLPIIVGGTGLYFKALLEGLAPIPPIPPAVRARWRGEAERLGAPALHALLAERDPATAAGLRPTDPQRVSRALEVLEATGQPLSHWQRQSSRPILDAGKALRLVVRLDRAELWRRADARLDAVMAAGALDEARGLATRGYAAELPVMRALGVAPLIAAAEGLMSLDEAVWRTRTETRQYIKRQETWLRRHMISWKQAEL